MTTETFHVITTKNYKSGKKFEVKKYFQCPQETFPQIERNISRPKFFLGQCMIYKHLGYLHLFCRSHFIVIFKCDKTKSYSVIVS